MKASVAIRSTSSLVLSSKSAGNLRFAEAIPLDEAVPLIGVLNPPFNLPFPPPIYLSAYVRNLLADNTSSISLTFWFS